MGGRDSATSHFIRLPILGQVTYTHVSSLYGVSFAHTGFPPKLSFGTYSHQCTWGQARCFRHGGTSVTPGAWLRLQHTAGTKSGCVYEAELRMGDLFLGKVSRNTIYCQNGYAPTRTGAASCFGTASKAFYALARGHSSIIRWKLEIHWKHICHSPLLQFPSFL